MNEMTLSSRHRIRIGEPVDMLLICTDTKFSFVKSTFLNIEFRNVSFYGEMFLFRMYLILNLISS